MTPHFQRYRARVIGAKNDPKASIQQDSKGGTMYLARDVNAFFTGIRHSELSSLTLEETGALVLAIEAERDEAKQVNAAVHSQLCEALYITGAIDHPLTKEEAEAFTTTSLLADLLAHQQKVQAAYLALKSQVGVTQPTASPNPKFGDVMKASPSGTSVTVTKESYDELVKQRDHWHRLAQANAEFHPHVAFDVKQLQNRLNAALLLVGQNVLEAHTMAAYLDVVLKLSIEGHAAINLIPLAVDAGILDVVEYSPEHKGKVLSEWSLKHGDKAYRPSKNFETLLEEATSIRSLSREGQSGR